MARKKYTREDAVIDIINSPFSEALGLRDKKTGRITKLGMDFARAYPSFYRKTKKDDLAKSGLEIKKKIAEQRFGIFGQIDPGQNMKGD